MPRWPRLLLMLLFATSLALRAWVPAGWMPTPGAHSLAIMPCPAANPSMAGMMHGSGHHEGSQTGNDCFSPLLAGAALPDPPPAIAPPAAAAAVGGALFSLSISASGPAVSPPHSTGPPALT